MLLLFALTPSKKHRQTANCCATLKKTQKTPKKEIDRAERIREKYFEGKQSNNKKESIHIGRNNFAFWDFNEMLSLIKKSYLDFIQVALVITTE